LAIKAGIILGIQCTSGAHHADHLEKILAEPKALLWIQAGGWLELWSWSKKGAKGKKKTWQVRKQQITSKDFDNG
jgi:hypothetical protein